MTNREDCRFRVGRYRIIFTVETSEPVIIYIEEVKKSDERTYYYDILKDSNGEPYAVVMPYDAFLEMNKREDTDKAIAIPHEVVELHVLKGKSLVRAWRLHLGLTQKDVADKMGITQASFSQMENNPDKLRPSTLKRIADAMGIEWEQLAED